MNDLTDPWTTGQDPTTDPTPRRTRGVNQLLHPWVLGSVIGSAGASAFVNLNRGGLPGPWPLLALFAWLAALALVVWVVLLRRRVLPEQPAPTPRAGLVYLSAVVGMLALMSLGRLALVTLGRDELQPAVVVLAVGLHFVPFAAAFRARVFGVLGWSVAGLGAAGLAGGAVLGATAALASAVGTGLLMLVVIAVDQLRTPTA